MLNSIGFQELGSEKTLTFDAQRGGGLCVFALNRCSEDRIHVDLSLQDVDNLLGFLQERFDDSRSFAAKEAHEAAPMLVAGDWSKLSREEKQEAEDMKDRMFRHLCAEIEAFYGKHPNLKVDFRMQVELNERR